MSSQQNTSSSSSPDNGNHYHPQQHPRRNPDDDDDDRSFTLAWRRDPEESFSDWTIELIQRSQENDHDDREVIQYKNSTKTETLHKEDSSVINPGSKVFHVHRVYLASGPRRSDYFKTLFSTQAATVEQETKTTKLELPKSACQAFPAFLDFVYGGKDFFSLTTNTVVALHYLADYLQVLKLQPLVYDYIQEDLMLSNVALYCRESLLYGVDWVVEECIQVAAFSPEDLLPLEDLSTPSTSKEVPPPSSISSFFSSESSTQSPPPPSTTTLSPAKEVMAMLPPTKQVKLLQLSLGKSLQELKRFKRVPSRWNENMKDVRATHLPTIVNSTLHYPLQGSGLEFPGRVCPLFYFEQLQQGEDQLGQEAGGLSRIAARRQRCQQLQQQLPLDSGLHAGGDPLRIAEQYEREIAQRSQSGSLSESRSGDDNVVVEA